MSTLNVTMPRFHGSMTALITPFKHDDVKQIDYVAYNDLINHQIDEGTHGLIPCGTTGEASTLSTRQHIKAIEECVNTVNGRVPVIAGTGSNDTDYAIFLTREAENLGADATLIVTFYYNAFSQKDLYLHYKDIHDATSKPIILYSVPGRTGGVDILPETVARLANDCPRIVGYKDATGNMDRPTAIRNLVGSDFLLYSGNDDTVLEFMERGGNGCISVVSNVVPRKCAQMHEAWHAGEREVAMRIRDEIAPLARDFFVERSPKPVKYAFELMTNGLFSGETRRPLYGMEPESQAKVYYAMQQVNPTYRNIRPAYTNG